MKTILSMAAVAAAALGRAACDKPQTRSAYNNSGASATPAMPAEQQPQAVAPPASDNSAVSQAPAVSDTLSPNAAPPQGDAAAQSQSTPK